jgi:F-type H+-transporting ATPase subunit b
MEGLGVNLNGLIAQLVNFGLLCLLLWLVAYRPILRLLDERSARIKEGIDKTDAVREQLTRAEAEFAARRADGLREAQEIVGRANAAADRIQREAEERARQVADEVVQRAREEINIERQRAVADLRAQVADLAILAAGRVVRSTLDPQQHVRLVQEALTEAEKARLS